MPESSITESRRIYSGDDANALVRQLAEKRAAGQFGAGEVVSLGVPYFDANNPPLMRGELSLLLGLTSHGKTLMAATVAKHTIERIGNIGNRGLLVVMTEETVEARRIQMWGDSAVTIRGVLLGETPMDRIDKNILASAGQPVYFIGQTTALNDVGTNGGTLRPSTIADGIHQLLARGIEPELLLIDHAHDLEPDRPYRGEQERFDSVAEELKQLANALGSYCPILALAQCKKEVEQRPPEQGQPNAYDLKYMQALAARARDIFSIYYPQRHKADGLRFNTVSGKIKASKGTFLVHCAKARNGRCAGETLAMSALDDDGLWSNQLREMNGGFI